MRELGKIVKKIEGKHKKDWIELEMKDIEKKQKKKYQTIFVWQSTSIINHTNKNE